jgi:hypothetical protein
MEAVWGPADRLPMTERAPAPLIGISPNDPAADVPADWRDTQLYR